MKKLRKIVIKEIPQDKQRYLTTGDYWVDKKGDIQVRISQMKNPRSFWLALIHEVVEMCLTTFQGVSWKKIDDFDFMVEKERGNVDPGDERDAPYYKQHHIASAIEMLLTQELEMNFEDYWKESVTDITK